MFGPNGSFYFGPGATMNNVSGAALSQYGLLYNSLASFLTGAPTQYGVSNFLVSPTIRQTEYSAWAGDTLTFFGRLTIDLGLRWEIYSPLSPARNGGAAFFNASNNTFNYSGINGGYSTAYRYDLHDFAPRFGYAFRVSDKTTIRGGYGISYFQTPYLYSGFLAPTYGYVTGVNGGFGTAALTTPFNGTLTHTAAPAGGFVNGTAAGNLPAAIVPRGLRMPYIQSFSTEIQQEFYGGTVLEFGYVGTLGREMPYIQELNASMPGTGLAGLPFYAMGRTASTLFFNDALTDNYNALQVKLSKRFSKRLDFGASYTWSKALGYTTGSYLLLNPFNLSSNYGPMDYDRQNVLTLSHLWEIPWGRHGKSPSRPCWADGR